MIYLILALVLVGVTWWLGFDISRRVSSIQQNKKDLTFRSSASEALLFLKSAGEQAAVDRLFLENLLPTQDKLIDFPKDLDGLARINRVDMDFNFGEEAPGGEATPGHIAFNIIVKGELNNILNFLRAMEGSRYLMEFNAYNLTVEGKNYQAMINGKVFSQ